ncbi:MAG: hypothetical protein JO247_00650 [Chloroflexi bacterium]|nr:hypothetical protein [Chloroflexota bacterium]
MIRTPSTAIVARLSRLGLLCAAGAFGWLGTAAVVASPASACVIAPGTSTCAPDVLTVSPSATLVSSTTGTISVNDPTNGAMLDASYTEKVYRDPTNSFGAGCLTWVVQVTNTSTSADETIEHVTISNFKGFLTDIGTDSNGAPGFPSSGTQAPTNVTRNSSGVALGWDFSGSNDIAPGQSTVLLEAETNATSTVPGTVSVQDGVSGFGPAFGPALPEVAFVPALGLAGGVAFGAFTWRRRKRSRP